MTNIAYASPVALPIGDDGSSDYRSFRENRRYVMRVVANGKPFYYRPPQYKMDRPLLSPDIFFAEGFHNYMRTRDEAATHLLEATGHGFEMRASANIVKSLLGLDIPPRVQIQVAMVELDESVPSWKTKAYSITNWYAQQWPDLQARY